MLRKKGKKKKKNCCNFSQVYSPSLEAAGVTTTGGQERTWACLLGQGTQVREAFGLCPSEVAGGVVFLGVGDNSLASPPGMESGDTRMEEEEGESLLVGFPKAHVALVCSLHLGPAPKLLLAGLGWQH